MTDFSVPMAFGFRMAAFLVFGRTMEAQPAESLALPQYAAAPALRGEAARD